MRKLPKSFIDRLVVVTKNDHHPIKKGIAQEFLKEPEKIDRFAFLSTCARGMIILNDSGEALKESPGTRIYSRYNGWEAYEFLLRLKAGIESPDKGDTMITHELANALSGYPGKKQEREHFADLGSMLEEDKRKVYPILNPEYLDYVTSTDAIQLASTACHNCRIAREELEVKPIKAFLTLPPERFMDAMRNRPKKPYKPSVPGRA